MIGKKYTNYITLLFFFHLSFFIYTDLISDSFLNILNLDDFPVLNLIKENPLAKKWLVIPVCHEGHWFLILVENLVGLWTSDLQSGEGCKFFLLDSLLARRTTEEGLNKEVEIFQHNILPLLFKKFGVKQRIINKWKPIICQPPQQTNQYDCGIFLLHFIQQFCKSPSSFINCLQSKNPKTFDKIYIPKLLLYKRSYLTSLIVGLHQKYINALKQQSSTTNNSQALISSPTNNNNKNEVDTSMFSELLDSCNNLN